MIPPPQRWQKLLWPAVMVVGVVLLYLPPGVRRGDWSIFNNDFATLHQFRIQFVQAQIAEHGVLPGWYPRELCGTPFWSNSQNFPFIPTRLILLWLGATELFAVGVILAACLAAGFTHLYCRRIGFHPLAAASAGWTFAAAGYFASRIPAGHLPLLEAYPALPLLLWLIERCSPPPGTLGRGKWGGWSGGDVGKSAAPSAELGESRGSTLPPTPSQSIGRGRIVALGIAAMCISLAGHPQLSIYALGVALIYAIVRLVSPLRWLAAGSIVAGVGCAAFVLVPMSMLVARSTRVLPLDRAINDLAMPYARLLAAFLPWRDGSALAASGLPQFGGYPNAAYFWDTVTYVGWLPWIAAAALLGLAAMRRVSLDWRAVFLVGMAILGVAFSLSWVQQIGLPVRGTILRSPARLMYLPTFAICIALGAGLHLLLSRPRRWIGCGLAAVALGWHAWDLARHDRYFIVSDEPLIKLPQEMLDLIDNYSAAGRVAVDAYLPIGIRWRYDDAGFFDSILLARSYRGVMALSRAAPTMNIQELFASELYAHVLRACGVAALVTDGTRDDLTLVARSGAIRVYSVSDATPRAGFYGVDQVIVGDDRLADQKLRDRSFDPQKQIVIPRDPPPTTAPDARGEPTVRYERPTTDRILVTLSAPEAGVVQVLESFDIGWRARRNGAAIEIVPGNLMFMAMAVPAGEHRIEMEFSTPGKWLGVSISMLSALALAALGVAARRARRDIAAQEIHVTP